MALKIVQSSLLEKRVLKLTDSKIIFHGGMFASARLRFEQIDYVLLSDTHELTIAYGDRLQITIQTRPDKPKHRRLIDELTQRLTAGRGPAPSL